MKHYALFLLLLIGTAAQADEKVYPRAVGVPFLGLVPVGGAEKAAVPASQPVAEERVVEPATRTLAVEPVYFELDRADLSADARTKVLDIAQWMKRHPGSKIKVEAYTDPSGTFAHNKVLGGKRASAMQSAISSEGIDSNRILIVNHGGQPVERKAVVSEVIVAAD